MSNRVVELFVPLLSDEELHEILRKGEDLLNVRFTQKHKNEIVKFSSGLASITHKLALNMCQGKHITATQNKLFLFDDSDLISAIKKYISGSSDTLRKRYEQATKVGKVRKYDNGKIILEALASLEFGEVQQNTLLLKIQEKHPKYPQANLSTYLTQLQNDDKGRVIVFNPNNGKYSFSDPFISTYIKCCFDVEKEGSVDAKEREREVKAAVELILSEVVTKFIESLK